MTRICFLGVCVLAIGLSSSTAGAADGKINGDRDDQRTQCKQGSVTQQQINGWVAAAQSKFDNNTRFVYVNPELMADKDAANLARIAVFKALNHTAIDKSEIYVGEDVSDGHCAVYAIDVTALWNDGVSSWNIIAAGRGSRTGNPGSPRYNEQGFDAGAAVAADRLTYNAVTPSVYMTLINAPGSEGQLRRRLGAGAPEIYSAVKNAIVFGARIIYMRRTSDGRKYWVSCDRFGGAREGQEIPYQPGETPRISGVKCDAFNSQAHEAWHEMKNGFNAYYIWGNGTQLRGRAERVFVVDPGNPNGARTTQGTRGGYLVTGRSCITCHRQGVNEAPNDYAGQGAWAEATRLSALYDESRQRFVGAMWKIIEQVSDGTPAWNKKVAEGDPSIQEPINFLLLKIDQGNSDGGLLP